MNKKPTQCQRIKTLLEKGHRLTSLWVSDNLRIVRLASRINELKQDPYNMNITDKWIKPLGRPKYKEYYLKDQMEIFHV